MKKIEIKKLKLTNFKGVRYYVGKFDGEILEIRGRNASGKTTLFDAFLWLLFGKDHEGRKNFYLKTFSREGKEIEKIPHIVEAELVVDGKPLKLERRYVERHRRKRGAEEAQFDGHTEEFFWDSTPLSFKEWQERISELCPEETFKMITSPHYFLEQKPEVQRRVLEEMTGEITYEELAKGTPAMEELLRALNGSSMEDFKRQLTAGKSALKKELGQLPARLEEQQRLLSAVSQDFAPLKERKREIEQEIQRVLEAHSSFEKRNEQLLGQRLERQRELYNLEEATAKRKKELHLAAHAKADEYKAALETIDEELRKKRREEKLLKTRNAQLRESEELLRKKLDALRAEWGRIQAQELTIDASSFVCPTCQRPFEEELIEEKQRAMQEAFLEQRATQLLENQKEGRLRKKALEEMLEEIQTNEARQQALEGELTALLGEQKALEAKEKEFIEAFRVQLGEDSVLRGLAEQKALKAEALKETPALPSDEELQTELQRLRNESEALTRELAKEEEKGRYLERIKVLEGEQQTLSEELALLEGQEFTAQQLSEKRARLLEERTQQLFRLVRFRMFEPQVNGALVETCQAMIDGTPYPTANSTSQLNAGLDVIDAITKHYQISAPIFIDNAESFLEILPTDSQQLRLKVASEELNIRVLK